MNIGRRSVSGWWSPSGGRVSGIGKIVGPQRPFDGMGEQWDSSLSTAMKILREGGVEIVTEERVQK